MLAKTMKPVEPCAWQRKDDDLILEGTHVSNKKELDAAAYNTMSIAICADAIDAIKQGYLYRPPVYMALTLDKAVVVRNGTAAGNPTVDFILKDSIGQKYVFMTTGTLLQNLAGVVKGVKI